jgi:DNA-binding CsgD family transcriptional regulator
MKNETNPHPPGVSRFPSENFPTGFQEESLATLNKLLSLSYSLFALVDPSIRSKGIVLQNLAIETDNEYEKLYSKHDPLHPKNFKDSPKTVVCLDNLLTEEEIFQSIYYREFMRPHNMRYVADMFLRREQTIVAVISMMRNEKMNNFSAAELILLTNLCPLLEFSLNNIYKPQRLDEHTILVDRFQYTTRELEVIEHIISCSSNKSISEKMYISLSTVKTHLRNIFEKTAVTSRTKLLATIYQAIQ